jgi:hypothetical protein
MTAKSVSGGDLGKVAVPKIDLAGNPSGSMAELFEDTKAQPELPEQVVEEGAEAPEGDATPPEKGEEEHKPEGESEAEAPTEEEGEEEQSEPEPEGDKKQLSKVELEKRKLQGHYDRTKQELKIATDLLSQAQPLMREVEELRQFKAKVEPRLADIEAKEELDAELANVHVPDEEMTGKDKDGNPAATEDDKVRVLSRTKVGLTKLIDNAVNRKIAARDRILAERQVMFGKLQVEILKVEPGFGKPGVAVQVERSFTPEEQQFILNPAVSLDAKRKLYVGQYTELVKRGMFKAAVNSEGEAETLTPEDLQKEAEAQKLAEKKAGLIKSQGRLAQVKRGESPSVSSEEKKIMDDMEKFITSRKRSPLL